MTKPERVWNLILVGFHWALFAFIFGTFALIGPIRWMARLARRNDWSQGTESALAIGVIVLVVLASLLAASLLIRLMSYVSRAACAGLSLATITVASMALGMWLNPVWVASHMGSEVKAGDRFTYGPYPSEERMQMLKAEGYTAVVSLLHPAVIPFEPKLIADEKAAADRLGLKFIHVPMLPWVSGNENSVAHLALIARDPGGRYYIHCYLGQDRVKMARAVIERSVPGAMTASAAVRPADSSTFRKLTTYERGAMYELEPDVFLLPYPTDEEFVAVVGTAKTIVSLLDPRDPNDRPWVERERTIVGRYGTKLVELPMPTDAGAARTREIVRSVKGLPRPVVVHSFLSPSTGRAPASEAFLKAYREE